MNQKELFSIPEKSMFSPDGAPSRKKEAFDITAPVGKNAHKIRAYTKSCNFIKLWDFNHHS